MTLVNPNDFADRYVAAWTETDPEARRKRVEELWAPDGIYANAIAVVTGHEAIATQVGYAHDAYATGGFTFRSCNNARGQHDTLRFNWVMVSEATGALEAVGFDFVTLDDEGRIIADHQYFDTPPTYVVPAPGEAAA
ncbi:SnoaL-like protein [Streptomyces sp. TLI_55]|uniref:nuclear transport factor 2 family protein n=1 Tax=Streptomyces sp. TLI_55 TaxID=1938861 RepID=UPI000BC7E4A1|nr:nuclear transport factor 2 family protein [Streptomyces sp. TLI_55]SNX58045.1 SnoaL-like protein [Streptomyces sp. TLI_55]